MTNNLAVRLKRSVVMAVSALAVLGALGLSAPAMADDHRGGDRGWEDHARHARDWHRGHPVYDPGVVYAPPPVVYGPPPSPGINLILPLDFR
jgi:hypothetical protein